MSKKWSTARALPSKLQRPSPVFYAYSTPAKPALAGATTFCSHKCPPGLQKLFSRKIYIYILIRFIFTNPFLNKIYSDFSSAFFRKATIRITAARSFERNVTQNRENIEQENRSRDDGAGCAMDGIVSSLHQKWRVTEFNRSKVRERLRLRRP